MFSYIIFKKKDDFIFDPSNNNIVTLVAGSLNYEPNRQYEIYALTSYLGSVYSQKIRIAIQKIDKVPVVAVG